MQTIPGLLQRLSSIGFQLTVNEKITFYTSVLKQCYLLLPTDRPHSRNLPVGQLVLTNQRVLYLRYPSTWKGLITKQLVIHRTPLDVVYNIPYSHIEKTANGVYSLKQHRLPYYIFLTRDTGDIHGAQYVFNTLEEQHHFGMQRTPFGYVAFNIHTTHNRAHIIAQYLRRHIAIQIKEIKDQQRRQDRVHFIVNFQSLRSAGEHRGLILEVIRCPYCSGTVTLPSRGNVTSCQHCGKQIYAVDLFEKLGFT